MEKLKTVKRTINYFEITIDLNEDKDLNDFIEVFTKIRNLSVNKSPERFVKNNDKQLYLNGISIDEKLERVSGKLLNIRMENFPELMNTIDDVVRDIEAEEAEGIIETSHFILSYSNSKLILSFEFNQFGPRISDFIYYLERFLNRFDVLEKLEYQPFVRDDLPNYRNRIKKVSSVVAKVHKDNVKRVNDVDSELFDAIETASNISESEYVTLELKYDYRKLPETPKITNKMLNIIDKLIRNKKTNSIFSKLVVKAEDASQDMKIKDFDLLNIWIKTQITVEKKPKSRVIVSEDILSKMAIALSTEFKGR